MIALSSGGRGRWFESTHSDQLGPDAPTLAPTQPPEPLPEWRPAPLSDDDWAWADEQVERLGLSSTPTPIDWPDTSGAWWLS